MSERTGVIVISSSDILCGGLMTVLARTEFAVDECLPSVPSDTDAGLILIDPTVPGYSRVFGFDVPVVAVIHAVYDEESLSQFAAVLNIYDTRQAIIRKLRKVVSPSKGTTPAADGGELSPREKEILVCVAKGMLNKEIAYKYNISIFTVMTHRKNITAKTGIKSVAGLTAYAILQGLIDIESIK